MKDSSGGIPDRGSFSGRTRHILGMGKPMPIAIVGMACRLPGNVSNLTRFWDFCHEARNSWTEFPPERLNTAAFHHPNAEKAGCFQIKGAHFLQESLARFDAPFFNITAEEAKSVDPRHRLLLECTYEALENGGISMSAIAGQNVGVYIGGTLSHYESHCLRDFETAPRLQFMGCADSLLANRISYFFDLRGPSATVDTACSSGLTALHLACQSLRTGEVSQAIVGGCHLNLMPEVLTSVSSSMLYSAEGKCFPFDERVSGGFGPGEGVSCLVLKPLQDAIDDGDCIRAIIRNSGMNQDGKTMGISLPSTDAQAALIRSVYESADLDPTETKYIEAHGTGTTVGDPLEAAAFAATVGARANPEDPVFIGSVKSNFGHLEGVSGIVSVIKAAMMLEKRIILPNANFKIPNAKIEALRTGLKVPISASDWASTNVRRVSVNNLGFGGSNAHAVLEEAPRGSHLSENTVMCNGDHSEAETQNVLQLNQTIDAVSRLYVLTANDKSAVQSQINALKSYLKERNGKSTDKLMLDLAFTLGQRRSFLKWKTAFVASTADALIAQLESGEKIPNRAARQPKLGFVFTGQGANWHAMGRELLYSHPVFLSTIAAADKHLVRLGARWSLVEELSQTKEKSQLHQAHISQPACTAIQLALVNLLQSWGIRPHAVTGHSSGEIAAAFAAGALTLEACLTIAYYRGFVSSTLQNQYPETQGAMLAIGTNQQDAASMIREIKGGQAVVACINSPSSITVSGDLSAIVELQKVVETRKLFSRRLRVDVAYHSPHMNLIAEEYQKALGIIKPALSRDVQFFSSLTGSKTSTFALGSHYWVSNLKSPVQFSDALSGCCSLDQGSTPEDSVTHLIEIGPHSALKGPIRDILAMGPKKKYHIGYSSCLVRDESAVTSTLRLASELFTRGCHLDLSAINSPFKGDLKAKVLSDLPPYPWNHEREYWHESRISQNHRLKRRLRHDLLGTLAADSNDIEPRWRNILRLDDVPWLRHHKIRSNCVFPFAGYVAMAVEAATQQADLRQVKYSRIDLRNMFNHQPLVILEGVDVEVMLTLRPSEVNLTTSSENWDYFKISSWTADGTWVEHCHGLVAALPDQSANAVANLDATRLAQGALEDNVRKTRSVCVLPVESQRIYEEANNLGINYGPCMTRLRDCRVGDNHALGVVEIPDTASLMPRRFETPSMVHPVTLDNCLHILWPLLGVGRTEVDRIYLPTSAKYLSVRTNSSKQGGDCVQVFGTASVDPYASERVVDSIIVIDPDQDSQLPFVKIEELTLLPLAEAQSLKDKQDKSMCTKIQWEPCLDLLGLSGNQHCFRLEAPTNDEIQMITRLEHASLFYFDAALKNVNDLSNESLQSHHKRFYHFMQNQLTIAKRGENPLLDASWDCLDNHERKILLEKVRSLSVAGELICRIGENIPQIMLNTTDALSLMLADGLLERYYRNLAPLIRNSTQAAMLVDNLAHKNPNLRILEIGAGTGGLTLSVLEKLGGVAGRPARFKEYIFTDISNVFFEKAQEKLMSWGPLVTYRQLDIEEEPSTQGFESEAFDLIIAANVFHAAKHMTRTLDNTRRLLEPGGKLLLLEITTPRAQFFPFGLLPGWWLGEEDYRIEGPIIRKEQWDTLLKQTGFSGVDHSLPDYAGESVQSHDVILSTATSVDCFESAKSLVIVDSHGSSRLSLNTLCDKLSSVAGGSPSIVSLREAGQMDLTRSHCIFLDELVQPLLTDISSSEFEAIQNLCKSEVILWVVQGAQIDSSAPESSLAVGLTRCLQSENSSARIVTLDLDHKQKLPASRTSEVIAQLYRVAFLATSQNEMDCWEGEYVERNGCLYIPRVVQDPAIDQHIKRIMHKPVPYPQTYFEDNRAVALQVGIPGFLDSLHFSDHEFANASLKPDEVEIQVKAAGLNFRDVMAALGKIPLQDIGSDCAGVITAVGSNVIDLAVGDRVCGIAYQAFSTLLRCPASGIVRIPETITFNEAASLPVIFTTAYQSIANVAHLCKGESILIHAAAGGIGQAAIMLSQSIGAEIYATVGSVKKKEFIMDRFGIPGDRIFYSRDTSFEYGIMNKTGGRGVDVALNSLSGEALQATWRCVSHFGRFVEIGKADLLAGSRLPMKPFINNRAYAAVDLHALSYEKPALMKSLLLKMMEYYSQGILRPVSPITSFPYSKIEAAFRTMQGGDHIGKIVLMPQPADRIQIMPSKTTLSNIRPDAAYLITGGSGGLAYAFTKWLADEGAKFIILASRSGNTDEKTGDLMVKLRSRRITVLPYACDVAVKDEVEKLVREASKQMPSIRGIIHGAMVNRPALFENSTVDDYRAVIKPKVHGAWNLHNALLQNEVDFFVSLASCTGVIGNRGQAAYCATTTFLNAFSSYRMSLGLPASTIDFGVVAGVGFLAERPELHLQSRKVLGQELSEKELLAVLDAAVSGQFSGNSSHYSIVGLEYTGDQAQNFWSRRPMFSHMRVKAGSQRDESVKNSQSVSQSLQGASSAAAAKKLIYDSLAAKFSAVLMIPEEELSANKPLGAYGVDSLVAVELRNWISREMEAKVILVELLADNTLAILTETVFAKSRLCKDLRSLPLPDSNGDGDGDGEDAK